MKRIIVTLLGMFVLMSSTACEIDEPVKVGNTWFVAEDNHTPFNAEKPEIIVVIMNDGGDVKARCKDMNGTLIANRCGNVDY